MVEAEEGAGEFVLKTRVPFDREQKEFYNLTVRACDNGKPTLWVFYKYLRIFDNGKCFRQSNKYAFTIDF